MPGTPTCLGLRASSLVKMLQKPPLPCGVVKTLQRPNLLDFQSLRPSQNAVSLICSFCALVKLLPKGPSGHVESLRPSQNAQKMFHRDLICLICSPGGLVKLLQKGPTWLEWLNLQSRGVTGMVSRVLPAISAHMKKDAGRSV